ncbi:ubiquitin-protein ligase peroxin 12, partial [Gonapodya sp. JEL0774]
MAAAFLANTYDQSDPLRPSYFELSTLDDVRDRLQPALRYFLTVYAQRYPRYLLPLVNRHEELYALLFGLVESYYLWEHDGSFEENFYGLKRAPTAAKRQGLSSRERWGSLVTLIAVPYVRSKLQELYESVGGGAEMFEDDFEEEEARRSRNLSPWQLTLRRLFRRVYPYTGAVYGLTLFTWQILYMHGRTRYYSPWLYLLGLEIKRIDGPPPPPPSSDTTTLLGTLSLILRRLLEALKVALPLSMFALKFLEWWYNSGFARKAEGGKPIPRPPRRIKEIEAIQFSDILVHDKIYIDPLGAYKDTKIICSMLYHCA